jgi:hypothetical protein
MSMNPKWLFPPERKPLSRHAKTFFWFVGMKFTSLLFVLVCPALARAQVAELWVARYNGPGNGDDVVHGMAVDSKTGNVYVTGSSPGVGTGADYATVAYDSSGNQLWVARYNGPANGDDVAKGVAVDSKTGNVYVTGTSSGVGGGSDFATVAYDSSGNQLWVARYHGPVDGSQDGAVAIAVNRNTGTVYVYGQTVLPCASSRCATYHVTTFTTSATVAYDSSGNQLWVATDDISNIIKPGESISPQAFAVDSSSGNVYVVAQDEVGITGSSDARIVAYDHTGTQLWATEVAYITEDYVAPAITLSSAGNIYIAGTKCDVVCPRPLTVAYDPTGRELWRNFDFYSPLTRPTSMAVDSKTDNLYLTGNGYSVAYDSSGNRLWVASYGGPSDVANAVAVDSDTGTVYVTGQSQGVGTGADYATVAYDSSSNQLWVARYNGPANGDDIASGIAFDSKTGNLYVTGQSQGVGTGFDYATIAYSSLPPVVTISTDTATLWPPDGKMMPVIVSGTITGSGVDAGTAAYAVIDAYGQVQPSGSITLGSGGSYSFTIFLEAARMGSDNNDRQYTITVSAKNKAGKLGSASIVVTVPHDQATE